MTIISNTTDNPTLNATATLLWTVLGGLILLGLSVYGIASWLAYGCM